MVSGRKKTEQKREKLQTGPENVFSKSKEVYWDLFGMGNGNDF